MKNAKNIAIAANIQMLRDILKNEMERVEQATQAAENGDCVVAIGALSGLGDMLAAAKSLHDAAMILARR